MARALRLVLTICCLLLARTAMANTCTTCYIDYENGNDSWDGTSKTFTGGSTGPWKHAPGMLGVDNSNNSTGDGCAANCLAQNPVAGDRYVLKGGVVWPYKTLPWVWTWAGSGTSSGTYGCAGSGCIYIGYDPTWNKGIVNSVTLIRDLGGCNPAAPPTVTFSGGGGSGAAATAKVIPAAAGALEPNVAGFIYHVTTTNQGSGYTTNPMVSIAGGGCAQVSAVADIHRPVIDAGGNFAATGYSWDVGVGPNSGQRIWSPGLALNQPAQFVIVDHLEYRNIQQTARGTIAGCVKNVNGFQTAFLSDQNNNGGNNTFSYNYIHGRFSTCRLDASANNQEQADAAIKYTETDEVAYNTWENGESFFAGTSGSYCGTNKPCIFSEHGANGGGGHVHHNISYANRWMIHQGGTPSVPVIVNNNEMWLILYDYGSAHVNEFYSLYSTGTLYEYNNIFHSVVSGGSNQQQMGNGTTQYFFNNVSWGLGGGTPNYGIDTNFGAGPNGGHFYFYNNTMYGNGGTRNCIDGNASNNVSVLFVVLQNNHCITNANPYYLLPNGANISNQSGSTSASAIQVSSTVQTAVKARSQRYTPSTAFAPVASAGDTVTFAVGNGTANLSSLCTGLLEPLCQDVYGNPRPTSGGWQAGAFSLNIGKSALVAPPSGLTVTAQ